MAKRSARRLSSVARHICSSTAPCTAQQQQPDAAGAVSITAMENGAGFGAVIRGCDVAAALADPALFATIRDALHTHLLLVIKDQQGLDPEMLAAFTHSFDPAAPSVWRDLSRVVGSTGGGNVEGDIMLPGRPAPSVHVPEVELDITPGFSGTIAFGQAEVQGHFGFDGFVGGKDKNQKNSQVVGGGVLQWHIDGAFYRAPPPLVTALQCFEAPPTRTLEWSYGGFEEPLRYQPGSTVYTSAVRAYAMLEPSDQQWLEGVKVHYGQNPFEAVRGLPMSMNGLQVVNDESKPYIQSEEAFAEEDPELLVLPAVWTHHATGHKAFMVHSRCMWHMELADGTRLSIDESREVCNSGPLLSSSPPLLLSSPPRFATPYFAWRSLHHNESHLLTYTLTLCGC
jgi:alpha-ketoglutarate-dependent taurine dioxygenase